MLTFTPGPLVTVGEFGTGELDLKSDDPAFEAFLVRFLAVLAIDESIPETPELDDVVLAFISLFSANNMWPKI